MAAVIAPGDEPVTQSMCGETEVRAFKCAAMIRAKAETAGEHNGRERWLCCHGFARASERVGLRDARLPPESRAFQSATFMAPFPGSRRIVNLCEAVRRRSRLR